MNDALYIAATGMQAQQQSIDTIANNLANVNTVAFKRSRVNFQELMQADTAHATSKAGALGMGISADSVAKDFTVGALTPTSSPMDLAINGSGFIEVTMADGSRGYSRGGSLQVSKDSFLTTSNGHVLRPAIHVPTNVASITIAADGKVSAQTASQSQAFEIGQVELVNFANPGALQAQGNGVYTPTEASGEANYGKPGSQGMGTLVQGSLENSNVTLVDEMVNLMVAQRAYELSSKVIQASDEIMSLTNNLRRA